MQWHHHSAEYSGGWTVGGGAVVLVRGSGIRTGSGLAFSHAGD
jgi:hypothetical protein